MPTTIIGTQGDDVLNGTALDDVIQAGWGDDVVDGGDGNDTIIDTEGSSIIHGGAGDDLIRLSGELNGSSIYYDIVRTKVIEAGDGADIVEVQRSELQDLKIDLGAGADLLTLSIAPFGLNGQITTGAGADRIVLDAAFGDALRSSDPSPLVITDFTAGPGGDILDIGGVILKLLATYPHADNPFADGHLILVQDGADVIVRIDLDGAAGPGSSGWYDREFVRLTNVNVADLTAYNLAGYAPDGSGLAHSTVNGTGGSEWLNANVGGSDVHGLGGNDRLTGNIGNDVLDGGSGNDTINGGYGNDLLLGGDGDDVLLDPSGADTFDGGAGNDIIDISRLKGVGNLGPIAINGGDGDDFVRFESPDGAALTVDLGAGNDRFELPRFMAGTQLTLGAGQDHVVFGQYYLNSLNGAVPPNGLVISDFTAGNGGDVLELDLVLAGSTSAGWNGVTNPFAGGYLLLQQSGADTLVIWDYDGAGPQTYQYELARLVNVNAGSLTAFNFNGYAPNGSASSYTVISGTSGNDHLYGSWGADTINGGDGNDLIEDRKGGSDTLIGGAGDDTIILDRYDTFLPGLKVVTIDAGTGRDTVELLWSTGQLSVDLGADDDRVVIHSLYEVPTSITLGTGADIIELAPDSSSSGDWTLTIQDFTTGPGGDRLDWASYVEHRTSNGDPDYNPFYEGNARLVQVGSDVQLQIATYISHQAAPLFTTVMVFANTNVADFTAENLGYELFLPTASGGAGNDTLTGTAGNDVLYGNGGDDLLDGLGGDDVLWAHDGADTLNGGTGIDFLRGGAGNDSLNGGSGADNLDGEGGIDMVDGGDGDDLIFDWFGADTVIGGAGNDTINVNLGHESQAPVLGSLMAGEGNDVVNIANSYWRTDYSIDLGAGDDTITMVHHTGQITLGTGRDTVVWASSYNLLANGTLVLTDFAAGDTGDIFDAIAFLRGPLSLYSDIPPGYNPFAAGHLELRQVGNDVEMFLHREGYDPYSDPPVVRFLNTDLSQLTAANFGGFDPQAAPNWTTVVSSDLTIAAGEIHEAINVTGVNGFSPAFMLSANLVNHGTITSLTDSLYPVGSPTGIYGTSASAFFLNASDGHVFVRGEWADGFGVASTVRTYGIVGGASFQNDGEFEVSAASGIAYGHYSDAPFTNNGTFTVTSAYDAYGVYAQHPNNVVNNGSINVHGGDFAIGYYFGDARSGVSNAGSITVTTDLTSPYASIGIYMSETIAPPSGVFEHYNSGTITADIAFWIENDHSTTLLGKDVLHNSGTINGEVILSFGDDIVDNTGVINGTILLGAGNDTYSGSLGHNHGTVEGGTGNDTLKGGTDDDALYGDSGNDIIYGGTGDDFIEGGAGTDTLLGQSGTDYIGFDESLLGVVVDLAAGTASDGISLDTISGFEGIVGSRFDDVIRGAGNAETLLGGDGDDHIDGGLGNDVIRGERGSDDLTGGAGNDKFLFSIGDGHDIIRDFAAGDRLAIYGFAAAPVIEQVGSNVLVTLSATDRITLLNTTVATVQTGLSQSLFPLGDALPVFDQTIIAANENLVIPAGVAVTLTDPADFDYRQSTYSGQGILLTTVSNTMTGPDFFNAGTFNFVDSGHALIVGIGPNYAGYWSDDNDVVNEATGTILIENFAGDAIGATGLTKFYNLGTMSVVSHSGDASGFIDLSPFLGTTADAYFVNAGTIDVEATGSATVIGRDYNSDSQFKIFNSGSMLVHGQEASTGIDWVVHAWAPPFINNSGQIIVSDETAAKDSAAIRVDWGSDAQIWNSGTLQADYAIKRGPGFSGGTGTLSIYNSGSMIGDVDLYGGTQQIVSLINTGSISGDVRLVNSDDLFDGRQGSLAGTLSGMGGNDRLLTGAGSQTLLGGNGDDTLSGGAGADTLTGGAGADHFRFEAGFGIDTISDFDAATDHVDVRGYGAWQSIVQQGGDVVVTFAAGEQLIFKNQVLANITAAVFTFVVDAIAANAIPAAPAAPDAPAMPLPDASAALVPIYGTAAANTLNGTGANEALAGAGGNDVLNGYGGDDRLDGGLGNDTLNGGVGMDLMMGGAGDDNYIVDSAGDVVTENAGEGTDTVQSSIAYLLGANLENLTLTGSSAISGTGNSLGNSIRGNSSDNILDGGSGDDRLYGNAGNDTLVGGAGYDRLYGGTGDDTYYVNDADDYAYENADEGHDFVISSLDHQLRVEVEDLLLTGSALIGKGNAGDNGITGNAGANKLYGYEGNDHLDGGAGDDYLLGAEGNDTLTGGAGYDRMYGGVGNDTYIVTDASDYAYENLGEGTDRVIASINHVLRDNIEELELAGTADLRGYGNGLDNLIIGNSGANLLYGRDGQDSLNGNGGNDILYGENGNDHLNGGSGLDRFYGGTGADQFIFNNGDFAGLTSSTADRIHDFSKAEGDTIRLDGVDANSVVAGDQGFAFIGTGAFSHTAGELRYAQISGNTYVQGDTDGDGQADFWIRLDGLHALAGSDFIL